MSSRPILMAPGRIVTALMATIVALLLLGPGRNRVLHGGAAMIHVIGLTRVTHWPRSMSYTRKVS